MEGLVNYSSEDEQDDYPYTKAAVRERGSGSSASTGRAATDASGPLKRSYNHSKSGSCDRESSPYRKGRDGGSERFKTGNASINEDKYKIDRRADKSRDHRDKRDNKESRNNRDMRDGVRDYDNSHKYDYKKHDDHKRFREPKRDYKRDGNDYHKEDKRYNRDDRKSMYAPNYKDRFNSSKSRYDERKQHDDRFNDERRGGANEERRAANFDDRRRDFNDRRNNYNNDDDRKTDRRNNEDRRTQRSYNEDRSNAYRPRRSNSPAPSQRNSNNSKFSERKDDNNTRRERKRNSRSRSRSRSHSADNSTESNLASNNNNSHQRTAAEELLTETKRPVGESQVPEKKSLPTARNFEALLSLPLSENAPKSNVVAVAASSAAAGPNVATATVQLPSYYNPNVINPNKYVEQMQKRKLIWGAKKTEDSASKWGHAQFSQDQDGKVASKFMRLMGIKSGTGESSTSPNESEKKSSPTTTSPPNNPDVKSREAMFSTMEQQYEVARQVTHTMRGVGLGFGSQSRPY
ncbi:arginine/serine-rich coiled-coil protein 2 [Calliphora vicina]|uniref:arginine/serine-rich coiled-coil protein 2 n=1 Tax=Calliphora vicina TaxID=7373 RepID=UPI00325A6B01